MYKLTRTTLAIIGFQSFLIPNLANSTPIPDTPPQWYQGNQDYILSNPISACQSFNDNVALINAHIAANYPSGSAQMYEQLCTSFRVNEIQVEDSVDYITWVAAYPDYSIIDSVDMARTIDILVFSGTGKTNYMMIINGGADLVEQDILEPGWDSWTGIDMAPFHYQRDHWFGNNWHGTNQKSYISGEIALNNAKEDADDFFQGQSPTEEEYNTKVLEFLSDECTNLGNSNCIPGGGSGNSGYLIYEESYPGDTYEDKYVNVATSQGMSFNIGGSFEADETGSLTAGMSVDIGYETSTSQSQDLAMFFVSNFAGQNDVSSVKEYQVSANAVLAVEDSNVISYKDDEWNYRVDNADEAYGSNTWRKHDLESIDVWTENVNNSNCTDEPIVIAHTLNLARSTIDIDNGSIDSDDTQTVNYRFDYGTLINMVCETDSENQTVKAVALGNLYN
ncbi:hypothetical protein [Vibrio pectenicida]|uniref:Uncharacterized protein n=1 Tax=Vibrio pectenicida TaxID=62763 RepID=A0A3R9F622_9VIBR|nr:hypothetical protein [Vibrio pectenicida]RSD30694.1 hypothetical protein EJA03_12650 [Vibrio pectenicida]RSD31607.1 hypothetical protein EJA03_07980 [Vibrio pectenicida]